jgi:hypothetical protein
MTALVLQTIGPVPIPYVEVKGTSGTVHRGLALSWIVRKRIYQVVTALQIASTIGGVVATIVFAINLDRSVMATADQRRVIDIARAFQVFSREGFGGKCLESEYHRKGSRPHLAVLGKPPRTTAWSPTL